MSRCRLISSCSVLRSSSAGTRPSCRCFEFGAFASGAPVSLTEVRGIEERGQHRQQDSDEELADGRAADCRNDDSEHGPASCQDCPFDPRHPCQAPCGAASRTAGSQRTLPQPARQAAAYLECGSGSFSTSEIAMWAHPVRVPTQTTFALHAKSPRMRCACFRS